MTDQLFQRHVERLVTVHGLLEHQAVPRHDGLLSIQISDIPPVIFDICLRKRRPRTRGTRPALQTGDEAPRVGARQQPADERFGCLEIRTSCF